MNSIRVMLVDDHPVVRQGVYSLLSAYEDIDVVAEARIRCKVLWRNWIILFLALSCLICDWAKKVGSTLPLCSKMCSTLSDYHIDDL
ncbi:MAG: hypothetical protein R2867_39725 [Caldilineaceae bacterium]